MTNYIIGDIHEEIKKMDDDSIDFIYTNPPFATTNKKWDTPLKWKELFPEMWRVLKPNGSIALHCAIPFTYDLIQIEKPKYHYTWKKTNPTCFFLAKKQPLRDVEEILIFYKKQPTYNPQMVGDKVITYNRKNKYKDGYYGQQKPNKTTQKGFYPKSFLGMFSNKRNQQKKSPKSIDDDITNKMILTYSNAGDTILDMTCCDKNNGNIAEALNRKYIGIDISDEFLSGIK